MLTKSGKDEGLIAPHMRSGVFPYQPMGGSRAGQKLGNGVPLFKKLLLQTKRLQQKPKAKQ